MVHSIFYNQILSNHAIRYFEHLPTLSSFVMFFAFICGLGGALAYVSLQTAFQKETPNRLLGRAQAFLNMISYAVNIIPTLFFGALADILGVTSVLLLAAFGILGLGVYFSKSRLLSEMKI